MTEAGDLDVGAELEGTWLLRISKIPHSGIDFFLDHCASLTRLGFVRMGFRRN